MPAKFLCSAKNKTFSERKVHIAYLSKLSSSVICFFQVLTKYILVIQYVTLTGMAPFTFFGSNRICFLHVLNIKMTFGRMSYNPPWISPALLLRLGM